VKGSGSTRTLPFILGTLSAGGASGMVGVAVKCVDIDRNTHGEGSSLACN
jgi:hypothetical protein